MTRNMSNESFKAEIRVPSADDLIHQQRTQT